MYIALIMSLVQNPPGASQSLQKTWLSLVTRAFLIWLQSTFSDLTLLQKVLAFTVAAVSFCQTHSCSFFYWEFLFSICPSVKILSSLQGPGHIPSNLPGKLIVSLSWSCSETTSLPPLGALHIFLMTLSHAGLLCSMSLIFPIGFWG